MLKLILYRGFHSSFFEKLLEESLETEKTLLIICPPRFQVEDLKEILSFLPSSEIDFIDDLNQTRHQLRNDKGVSNKLENFNFDLKIGLFTSGTSGKHDKLVLYTKKNFQSSVDSIYSLFKSSQNVFCYPQPYHIFGLSLGYIHSINNKVNLITAKGKYSFKAHDEWVRANAKFGDLITLGTPTHFLDLIKYIEDNELKAKLNKTYSAIIGGALVSKEVWNKVENDLKITQPSVGYGCTEASPGTFHLPPGICPEEDGDVGFALNGVDISFNQDGTYNFKGNNLAKTYLDKNGLHLIKEFNVLDVLKKNESKRFIYLSRKGDVINRGGEKFFPKEIEQFFSKEHSLKVICLKKKSDRLGEDFVLLVQSLNESTSVADVQNIFYNKFQRKVDQDNIALSPFLPINDNQKVDKRRCLELAQQKRD